MIQELIDKKLKETQEKREARESSGKIHPSSLGRCFRYQWWYRKGEKPTNPIDARTLRVFTCGKLFHDYVQSFIEKSNVEVEINWEDVHGFADVVDTETVYDIKTMHSKGFFYMAKQGYDVKKEKYGNWLQVATYALALNKPKVGLIIISKDDMCINEYYDLTFNWKEKVMSELSNIRKHWDSGTLPEAEARAYGGRECEYCNFLSKCREIGGKQWGEIKC